MRIQESDISLSSRHEWDSRHEIETHGKTSFRNVFQTAAKSGKEEKAQGEQERIMRLFQSLVDAILGAVNGKKCRPELADSQDLPKVADFQPGGEVEWKWQVRERIEEHERTQVEGGGVIKTADGKSIDFKVNVDMCRDYSCERDYQETGKMALHDPLVINFDGKATELKSDRYDFDLDADGKVEKVPGLGKGSAYLVLDSNGNGKVDNGSELFGTGTGNGFADLAKLDKDGNGWLDEADPDFAKLKLWQGGKDDKELVGLKDKGIGALWLGSTGSDFSLKDKANNLLGEIRATGLYLAEDGHTGTIQQVDLAVETEKVEEKVA